MQPAASRFEGRSLQGPTLLGCLCGTAKAVPFQNIDLIRGSLAGICSLFLSSVVSQKFIEEQLRILRLTTPNLHPTNEDLFVGTPERLKRTPGAPFAQDDS